jgi:hypothetical protein
LVDEVPATTVAQRRGGVARGTGRWRPAQRRSCLSRSPAAPRWLPWTGVSWLLPPPSEHG